VVVCEIIWGDVCCLSLVLK